MYTKEEITLLTQISTKEYDELDLIEFYLYKTRKGKGDFKELAKNLLAIAKRLTTLEERAEKIENLHNTRKEH